MRNKEGQDEVWRDKGCLRKQERDTTGSPSPTFPFRLARLRLKEFDPHFSEGILGEGRRNIRQPQAK
ncbi:hypothetical protein E2C01_062293 [Portunus trituberculatus]|uniref:Uncharacterized protein n=1 Tax=Portunus trituberculatus TaxID=210409 RepID=A0A5B7H625_PORTR|nr:hypothetical protein [Portunus trituberculatus]